MEPQSSLPYSQAPACPYPEPTPFPTTPSHFLKIHLNIILPSMSWSPPLSPSLRLPHQNLVHNSPFLRTCHMPRPPHSSRFINRTILGEQYGSLEAYTDIISLPKGAVLFCIIFYCRCLHLYSLPFYLCHSVNIYSSWLREKFCKLSLYILYVRSMQ